MPIFLRPTAVTDPPAGWSSARGVPADHSRRADDNNT